MFQPGEVGAPAVPEVQPPTQAELRTMFRTFGDAKDRWKIDGATMKGFYLHSESGYLYIWDQPQGILYEYLQASGQCQAVWSAACPQLNAELWTVLPLPPTDPASLQASIVESGLLPNIDVYLNLTIAHESGKQVPTDVLEAAVDEFAVLWRLNPPSKQALRKLPPAGQGWVIQNFRCDESRDTSRQFMSYLDKLKAQSVKPWGNSACTLRVEATGAIIGRCCPDLDALCREDPPQRLAQAHCKIMSEKDRFYICDLNSCEEGTMLDGFAVNEGWIGPLKTGSLITVGPLRIKIALSDMAKDDAVDGPVGKRSRGLLAGDDDEAAMEGSSDWQRKVYRRTEEDKREQMLRRQQQYKDRAEERRERTKGEAGAAAMDGLMSKFEQIKRAEELAEEAEERRVEQPTMMAHREANMNTDGSFVGFGVGFERAGIGFHSAMGELIPDVLQPQNLSTQDAAKLKMQQRFKQASSL